MGAKLECSQCHVLDEQRQYFQPIRYESQCVQCHPLNVPLAGKFSKELEPVAAEFVKTPLPHKEPGIVRAVLRDRLVQFAQKNTVAAGPSEPSASVRPLPWKPSTPVTDAQWAWAVKQGTQTEAVLFMNKQWSKTESLAGCTYCHFEQKRDGSTGLPEYYPTDIPSRWYKHSVFNHGSHRFLNWRNATIAMRKGRRSPKAKARRTYYCRRSKSVRNATAVLSGRAAAQEMRASSVTAITTVRRNGNQKMHGGFIHR